MALTGRSRFCARHSNANIWTLSIWNYNPGGSCIISGRLAESWNKLSKKEKNILIFTSKLQKKKDRYTYSNFILFLSIEFFFMNDIRFSPTIVLYSR